MESPGKDLNVFPFGHPHPLELTTSPPTSSNSTCSGCKLNITSCKSYYGCKSCSFCLHYFCNKLPIITQHPAHSSHDLVLLVIRSPPVATKDTAKCLACGHHVTAFCYHCAECGVYFHTFCLALPLSISIANHPHKLKLEVSPPYDFFCDMCKKTSYNGWLYRCNSCEFDMHLACAVQSLEPQSLHHPSFLQSNTLLRKIGSPQVTHMKSNNGGVGDNSIGSEILHLMAQQIGGNNESKVIGWDKRIYSPRQSKTASVELQLTEVSPVGESRNVEGRTPLQDKLTPRSDVTTPPSYQFSEACFSIDLARSYAETRSVAESKGTSRTMTSNNSGQVKEPLIFVNWPSFSSYNAPQQSRLNSSFLNGGRTSSFAEPGQKAVKHKLSKPDSERYGKDRSCWKKSVSCCL